MTFLMTLIDFIDDIAVTRSMAMVHLRIYFSMYMYANTFRKLYKLVTKNYIRLNFCILSFFKYLTVNFCVLCSLYTAYSCKQLGNFSRDRLN